MVDSVERRAQAVALRRDGKSYARIGEIMGVTRQTAWSLVTRALLDRRAELNESVDDLRDLDNERLNKMLRVLFKKFDDPRNEDPERTVTAILRTMERHAALNGLDAPKDFRIGTGVPIPPGGDIDVTKLSDLELQELEEITARYDALRSRSAAETPALPAGEPVAIVPPPDEGAKPDGTDQSVASG